MPIWGWIVVAVVVVLLAATAVVLWRRSRRRPPMLQLRPLPEGVLPGYLERADELEKLFVSQPREATASAKLLVDDMLVRMGYPIRLTDHERVRDLRRPDPENADRYQVGADIKGDASTEQLRRSLQAYLDMAREIATRPSVPAV
ncbi:MAG: hypothetical protein ACREPI_12455 [Candidatus Dormibacterales bacterium]